MKLQEKNSDKIQLSRQPLTRTLLFVLLYMVTFLLVFVIADILNTKPGLTPEYSYEKSAYTFNKDLVNSKRNKLYLIDHWIIVPNVTPDSANRGHFVFDDYKKYPHVEDFSIPENRMGWSEIRGNYNWVNCNSIPDLKHYRIDGLNKYSVAYLTKLELPANTHSFVLSIPDMIGIARVYCNDKYIGTIGNREKLIDFKSINNKFDYLIIPVTDREVKLTIVVASNTQSYNPGIISYPTIMNEASAIYTIARDNTWYIAILMVFALFTFTLVVLRYQSIGIKNIISLIALGLSFFLFIMIDMRYYTMNGIMRYTALYSLALIISCIFYTVNCNFFSDSTFNNVLRIWKKDYLIPIAISIATIVTLIIRPELLGSIAFNYFTLILVNSFQVISVFKILAHYQTEPRMPVGICFSFTAVLCLTRMLDHKILTSNMSTYSAILLVGALLITALVSRRYIINTTHNKDVQRHMEKQIREKTLYISEINRDLLEKNRQLIAGEEARKSVLSNVSHDLRTPITAIRGYAELLLSNGANMSDEQRRNYVMNIIRRSGQMERIVSDIMELTKMEAGTNEFQFTDISLSEMLDEIVAMFSSDLSQTQKKLTLDIPEDDLLIVKADPRKISRVFENLISNSINYTHEEALIKINAWRENPEGAIENQRIHITISDNGIGIPEGEIDKIFDRFYRAKNSGQNITGTGLGLSIVHLIVTKHDAEITVNSSVGVGTTFEIIMKATY